MCLHSLGEDAGLSSPFNARWTSGDDCTRSLQLEWARRLSHSLRIRHIAGQLEDQRFLRGFRFHNLQRGHGAQGSQSNVSRSNGNTAGSTPSTLTGVNRDMDSNILPTTFCPLSRPRGFRLDLSKNPVRTCKHNSPLHWPRGGSRGRGRAEGEGTAQVHSAIPFCIGQIEVSVTSSSPDHARGRSGPAQEGH